MVKRRHTSFTGFTLVELLVVVAIIALLLSILLPSLARAREQSKRAKCLANLKDIGNASVIYATDDEGDILVPGPRKKGYPATGSLWFWGAQHFGGKGGDRSLVLTTAWQHAWTAFERFGPGDRPLNRIMFKNPTWESWYEASYADRPYTANDPRLDDQARLDMDTFRCPSDTGIAANTGAFNSTYAGVLTQSNPLPDTPFYDIMGNSYSTHWLSPLLCGDSCADFPFYGWGAFNRQITSVPNAARCVIYREGNAWDEEFYNSLDDPTSINLGVNGWHGEWMEFTAAFADGHAEPMSHKVRTNVVGVEDFGLTLVTGDYTIRGHRPEVVPMPENLNGPTTTFVLTRGDGWQMDYFPAPRNIVLADVGDLTGD